jgi:hypothetical protein
MKKNCLLVVLLLSATLMYSQQKQQGWPGNNDPCGREKQALTNCRNLSTTTAKPAERHVARKHNPVSIATTLSPAPQPAPTAPSPAAQPAPTTPSTPSEDRTILILGALADNQAAMNKANARANELREEANLQQKATDAALVRIAQQDADTRTAAEKNQEEVQNGQIEISWYDAKTRRRAVTFGFIQGMFGDVTNPLGQWLGRSNFNINATGTGGAGGNANASAQNTNDIDIKNVNNNKNVNDNDNYNKNVNNNDDDDHHCRNNTKKCKKK